MGEFALRARSEQAGGWRSLTDNERDFGRRFSADGLLCGTPRTSDDPRFDRRSVPVDAFAPNGLAVWAVIERLTWFRLGDAERLLRAAGRTPFPTAAEGYRYDIVAGARAAGGHRFADWEALREIARQLKEMIRPAEAGLAPGQYSNAAARWDDAFGLARDTAQALLVADRPELGDDAYRWLSGVWHAAFPEVAIPDPDTSEVLHG